MRNTCEVFSSSPESSIHIFKYLLNLILQFMSFVIFALCSVRFSYFTASWVHLKTFFEKLLYCILSHRVLVFIKRPSQVYADVEMFFKFIPKYQPSGEGGTRL